MLEHRVFAVTVILLYFFFIIIPPVFCMESLKEAWEIALVYDHNLQSVIKKAEAAKKKLSAAKALRLPNLNFNGGYTVIDDDDPAIKFGGAAIPMAQDEFLSFSTMASLPVFTSWAISNGIAAAESSLAAAFINQDREKQDLKLTVAEAYVLVLRSTRGLAVAKSHVESLESHATDVENLYSQGFVAVNDLLAAKVSLADAVQKELQAKNRLDIARSAYNRLLGFPLTRIVDLVEIKPYRPEQDLETLSRAALDIRHELKVLTHMINAMYSNAKTKAAASRPQIAVSGGYKKTENKYMEPEGAWTATLGVKWNFFDGGLARHKAGEIKLQAQALSEKRADVKTLITLQLRHAWLNIDESYKRVEVTQKALAQGEENLKVVKDRYQEGLATNTEVLDAETLRTLSHFNYDSAVYDAALSNLRLHRAVGDL